MKTLLVNFVAECVLSTNIFTSHAFLETKKRITRDVDVTSGALGTRRDPPPPPVIFTSRRGNNSEAALKGAKGSNLCAYLLTPIPGCSFSTLEHCWLFLCPSRAVFPSSRQEDLELWRGRSREVILCLSVAKDGRTIALTKS